MTDHASLRQALYPESIRAIGFATAPPMNGAAEVASPPFGWVSAIAWRMA
jgi:hypothetical protein